MATKTEKPDIKKIKSANKKDIKITKRLYKSKFPLAILLAASPIRSIFAINDNFVLCETCPVVCHFT